MTRTLETAESVAMGHPGKVADQISDAILDVHLKKDRYSRVAYETLIKGDSIVVAGEITSKADVDVDQVVRETVKRIGYTDQSSGFDLDKCSILLKINQQSDDINRGISSKHKNGIGDLGESASTDPAMIHPGGEGTSYGGALRT